MGVVGLVSDPNLGLVDQGVSKNLTLKILLFLKLKDSGNLFFLLIDKKSNQGSDHCITVYNAQRVPGTKQPSGGNQITVLFQKDFASPVKIFTSLMRLF